MLPGAAIKLDMPDGNDISGRFAGWTRDSASTALADSLPLRGVSVQVDVGFDRVSVPAEKIARIHVPRSSGTLAGLVVGLGLDILVIRSLANSDPFKPTGCEAAGTPRLFSARARCPLAHSPRLAPPRPAPSTRPRAQGSDT